jgi:hypothetical protein
MTLPNLTVDAYAKGGGNAIVITPTGNCEGLSKSVNLGSNFARVTVTYAPHDGACQAGTCDPSTGACSYSNLDDGTTCNDNNACTSGDACVAGVCLSGPPIVCTDGNVCTDDSCDPTTGCVFTNNTASCDDGNPCTAWDVCSGGTCQAGTPVGGPPEVQSVTAAGDKATFSWSAVAGATGYGVTRGSTSAFPAGTEGGDEVCLENVAAPTLNDPAVPGADSGFWYLTRGENACGIGTWGTQSDGTPRITTSCP